MVRYSVSDNVPGRLANSSWVTNEFNRWEIPVRSVEKSMSRYVTKSVRLLIRSMIEPYHRCMILDL